MDEAMLSPLRAWESYYVIVGSSGAALTGLQFVVIALVAEVRTRNSLSQIDAFGTPTVVHFGAALLVSAILSAPWHALASVAIALGVCGLSGLVYSAIVVRRARRQKGYTPVLEDWLFHAVFPTAAYAAVFGAAIALTRYADGALFVVAAAALGLLFIGIHNAWDTVTFIALTRKGDDRATPEPGGGAAGDQPAR